VKINNIPYFQHDNDMRNDPKIIALRNKFGLAGYAVFCFTLEALTDSKDFSLKIDGLNLEIMAGDFRVDPAELRQIYDYCFKLNLFQLRENDSLICEELNNRMNPLLEKRERWREKWHSRKSSENSSESSVNSHDNNESVENSPRGERKGKGKGKGKGKEESVKEINKEKTHTQNQNFAIDSPLEIPDEIHNIWRKAYNRNANLNEHEFTAKLINEVGLEVAERHVRDLSKKGFRVLASMEEATQVIETVQQDGTIKKILTIKPKDNNNGTSKQQPKTYQFDPERTKRDYDYLKQFERP